MERVIAYIDGFNLYYGLRDRQWQRYYWLNVQALAQNLLKASQHLVFTKYFTSRVYGENNKQKRQTTFIEALETLHDLEICYGKYIHTSRLCEHCGSVARVPNEKMTDVNIATQLVADAFQDRFDVALLVSGDSDLSAPVSLVNNQITDKRILIAFPPGRVSNDLAKLASYLVIGRRIIAQSQFPDRVRKADGFVLERPVSWG